VLASYRLAGPDAVDAIRSLRAALHGFVELERAGGFGLPDSVDRSYDRPRWPAPACSPTDRWWSRSR
jgi:Tetracyclin repressor-like, C-terminal domain